MSTITNGLTVKEINAADDSELAAMDTVYRDAELAVLPDADLHSYADLVTALRRPSPEQFRRAFIAVAGQAEVPDPDGRPGIVGAGMVSGQLLDHTDEAAVQVWVPPRYARAGIGRALADACEATARGRGRGTLVATSNAEVNQHMVAINDRFGFSVHSRIGTFQRHDR